MNATLPFGLVMARAIREYRERTGYLVGLKPAGGIRTAKEALGVAGLMKEELGDRWLRPDLFRFGASALLTDIERQLEHFVTGRYSAAHRIPWPDPATLRALQSQPRDLRRPWTKTWPPRPRRRCPARAPGCASTGAWLGRSSSAGVDGRPRGETLSRRQPRDGQAARAVTQAGEGRRRARARGAEGAPGWWALGGHGRARYLYALARAGPEAHAALRRARDARQRQADPRDARHRHPAGRAPLLPPRRLGPAHGASSPATSRRRRRADHPVELPAADAGLEDRAGAGDGKHGRAQAGRVHPLTALLLRRDLPGGRPAAGRRQHRHRRRRGPARDRRRTPTSTRSPSPARPRSGRIIRKATAGSGKKLSLELGGKSPFIVFDDADLDSVVEGVVDAIWFNQGQVCCAGSRLLVQEGVAERLVAKLRARMETLRVGDPLDKAVDMGAIVAPVQLERIQRLVAAGQRRGRHDVAAVVGLPDRGLLLSADAVHRRLARRDHRAGRDLRPGAGDDDLPHAGRGGRAGQQHALRPGRERLERRTSTSRSTSRRKIKAGVVWINSTNLFDAAAGFGGYRESGFGREGGREGMWEYLKGRRRGRDGGRRPRPERPGPRVRTGRRGLQPGLRRGAVVPPIDRTPKLYIGGKQARPDSGYSRRCLDRRTALDRRGRRGQPQGHPQRRRGGARRGGGWARATDTARADPLLHRREPAARADEFAGARAMTGGASARREVVAPCPAALHLRRLGRQVRRRGAHACRFRGVALAMNEPIGVIGSSPARTRRRCSASSRCRPAVAMGNTVIAVPVEPHPARRHRPLPGARDLGRAGGRDQHRHRQRKSWRRCWPSTTTWTRSGTWARARAAEVERAARRPT